MNHNGIFPSCKGTNFIPRLKPWDRLRIGILKPVKMGKWGMFANYPKVETWAMLMMGLFANYPKVETLGYVETGNIETVKNVEFGIFLTVEILDNVSKITGYINFIF